MEIIYKEETLIAERKKKLASLFKNKINYISYIFLGIIIWISVSVRTRNISKLKDISTGGWILGPDLDPFLFLRWAEFIIENGKLMTIDMMRYVPIGFDTAGEMKLLSYLIAWFHNFLSIFNLTDSVTYSAILFPVVAFAFTAFAFFLFSRRIFFDQDTKIKNVIALVATLLFVLMPALLPRTIAGIPEKESAAFFFMFISFYFFIIAYDAKTRTKGYLFSLLAGISTGAMALVWGGFGLVFMTIGASVLFAFLLGKIDKNKLGYFSLWLFITVLLMFTFSNRYELLGLVSSTTTGVAFISLFVITFHIFIFNKIKKKEKVKMKLDKLRIPPELVSLILSAIIIVIIASILLGPMFIPEKIVSLTNNAIRPLGASRVSVTVAENKQPFFINDWKNSFGPVFRNIPLFFWLFFSGSVFLFYSMIKSLSRKERNILTFSYFILLISLIFNKYSPSSSLNGENMLSFIVYFGGMLFFVLSWAYIYIKKYRVGDISAFE